MHLGIRTYICTHLEGLWISGLCMCSPLNLHMYVCWILFQKYIVAVCKYVRVYISLPLLAWRAWCLFCAVGPAAEISCRENTEEEHSDHRSTKGEHTTLQAYLHVCTFSRNCEIFVKCVLLNLTGSLRHPDASIPLALTCDLYVAMKSWNWMIIDYSISWLHSTVLPMSLLSSSLNLPTSLLLIICLHFLLIYPSSFLSRHMHA